MYTTEDIKHIKEEDRRETIDKFLCKYERIALDYRRGFISQETADKELCKLISKTDLHIVMNNL